MNQRFRGFASALILPSLILASGCASHPADSLSSTSIATETPQPTDTKPPPRDMRDAGPDIAPTGGLESPGPDVPFYQGPFVYARIAPSDSKPKIDASTALEIYRSRASSAGAHQKEQPDEFLGLYTHFGRTEATDFHDKLAWIISFKRVTATEPGTGVVHEGCSDNYVIDAESGTPLQDSQDCPPGQ